MAATALLAPAGQQGERNETPATGELVRRSRFTAAAHSLPRQAVTLLLVLAVFGALTVYVLPGSGVASVGDYEVTADGVELVRGDGSPVRLDGEGALADGDVVRTGESGEATLLLGPGTVARLGSATSVAVTRAVDDDPAATLLHRIRLDSGHVWVRQDGTRDPSTVVVDAPGVSVRVRSGGLDVGCGHAGCAVTATAGMSAATVGWDRFRIHAGETVTFGRGAEVGDLRALERSVLLADPWVAANAAADADAGFGEVGLTDGNGLDDVEVEGTWAVTSEIAESTTPDRPVGGEPERTWGVTRSCVDGACRLEIVDVAGERGAVGTSVPHGDREVVDGVTRTYDCVDAATAATTVEDAVAETRRIELWATSAQRSGGRWVATALAGTGRGTESWAGRGRVCRGIKPGGWTFALTGARIDVPAAPAAAVAPPPN